MKAIDIHTFDAAVDIIGKDPEKWRPRTRETADHSLPYCTAVALMDGDVTRATFDDKHLNDPALLDLVAKVKVHRDAALSKRYPRGIPNRMTVTLADGRQVVREVEFPRGHAENPMTDAEVEHKFRSLVEPRYGKERADRVLAVLLGTGEAQDAGGVGEVVREIGNAKSMRYLVPKLLFGNAHPRNSVSSDSRAGRCG